MGANVIHPYSNPVLLVCVKVAPEFHLERGIRSELFFLYYLNQSLEILHVLHFRCVGAVEQSDPLLSVEPFALKKLQFSLVGGPCEPILKWGEVGIVLFSRVSVESILEILNGLFFAAFLRDKIKP